MQFNNHIPLKLLILIGLLLVAAGVSFGYYIAQFDDLETAPAPAEQMVTNPTTTPPAQQK